MSAVPERKNADFSENRQTGPMSPVIAIPDLLRLGAESDIISSVQPVFPK
jgi:hypothetical protein